MTTKLLVPGLNGSGEGHWQRHWLLDDPEAILIQQSNPGKPDLDLWLENLESVLALHPGALLIAHSMGAIVVARLGHRPARHLVKGALLVAPCDLNRVESLHPGVLREIRDVPLGRLGFPSIVVASRNDPYMAFPEAAAFANVLGSDLVDLGHAGHINIASGHGRWDRGYRLASHLERHSYVSQLTMQGAPAPPSWAPDAHANFTVE